MPSAEEFLNDSAPVNSAGAFLEDHTDIVGRSQARTMTPFSLPKIQVDPENKVASSQMAAGGPNPYQFPAPAQKAAKAGVDVDSGAPYGLRSLSSLATKPSESLNAIRKYGVQGRVGPDSGVPEFLNDSTGRWTTLNSMNPTHEGVPTAGTISDVGGETLGGLAGSGGVVTTAAGVALGRALSEEGKYVVGGLLGIRDVNPDKPVDVDALKTFAYEGAKSGATALVAGGLANVGKVYQYARYGPTLFTKPIIAGDYWQNMQASMRESSNALDDYYSLAGNKDLKLDVAQLSNNPAAHAAMGDVRRGLQTADIDYAIRGQTNLSNLQTTFQDVTNAIKGPGPIDPMASGDKVVEWVAEQKAAALAQQQLAQKAEQDVAQNAVQGLPDATPEQITRRVTAQLGLIKNVDKKAVDKAYGDVAVMMGKHPNAAYAQDSQWLMEPQETSVVHTPTMVLQTQLQTLLKEAKGAYAVDSDITGAKLRAIPDGFLKEGSAPAIKGVPTEADKELLNEFGIVSKEQTIADAQKVRIGNTNYSIDMRPKDAYWVVQAIKGLRSGVRADMRNSKGWLPPDAQDQARVAEAISNDLKSSLETTDPKALDALESAESQAKTFGQRWRDSLLSEVANKKGGYQTPMVSNVVYHALFKTGAGAYDSSALNELSEIAKGSPLLGDTVRQSLLAVYRSQYTANGLPTPALHAKFLDDFEGPIRNFFTPAEVAQVKTIGNLGDVVAKRAKTLDEFNRTWSKSPYGQIPANSTMIAKAAFSGSNKVKGIGAFLRENNPELLGALQRDTATQLANRVMGASGGNFNVNAMDRVLASDTGRNLQDIMPPEYVAGLKTISNTAKMVTSTNKQVLPADESLIHRAVRLFTGAFGTEARAYHLIRGFRERQANRLLEGLLTDPDKMKQFMAVKDQSPAVAGRMGLLGALGAYGFEHNEDF